MNKRGFAPFIVIAGLLVVGAVFSEEIIGRGSDVVDSVVEAKDEIVDEKRAEGLRALLEAEITRDNVCSDFKDYESIIAGMCLMGGGIWKCDEEMIGCLDYSAEKLNYDVCGNEYIGIVEDRCNYLLGDFECSQTSVSCRL